MKKLAIIFCALLLSSCAVVSGPADEINHEPDDRGFREDLNIRYTEYNSVIYTLIFRPVGNGYSYFLNYYDLATGEHGYLCGKPDCEHNTNDCNAIIGMCFNIIPYKGKLYCFCIQGLVRMDLDGTNRETVVDFSYLSEDGHYYTKTTGYGFNCGFIHNDRLYLLGESHIVRDGVPFYTGTVAYVELGSDSDLKVIFHQEYEYSSPTFYKAYSDDAIYFGITYTAEAVKEGDSQRPLSAQEEIYCLKGGDDKPIKLLERRAEVGGPIMDGLHTDSRGTLYISDIDGPTTLSVLENGGTRKAVSFADDSAKYIGRPRLFGDGFFVTRRLRDETREIWIKNTDNETVYRGPLPLERAKEQGLEPKDLVFSYKGFSDSRFYYDLEFDSPENFLLAKNCHMAYELTEDGLKEKLLWIDE